ncbi:MAG: nitrate ABC transporter substrate-binding protein, partial [Pseudomonadota bacterium]
EKGDKRDIPHYKVFIRYYATYPFYTDSESYHSKMRRSVQIAEPKPDSWYSEVAEKVYRPDIYLEAARLLVDEGLANEADFPWDTDGYREPTAEFIDGVEYDGRKPNAYLEAFPIGLKGAQRVVGNKVDG